MRSILHSIGDTDPADPAPLPPYFRPQQFC